MATPRPLFPTPDAIPSALHERGVRVTRRHPCPSGEHDEQNPTARHDREGNLTVEFGGLDPGDPQLGNFPHDRHRAIPHPYREQDDPLRPAALWVDWRCARRAVERQCATWPAATVTAEGNPAYGKGDELAARLGAALAAIRAAEALVREGAERVGGAA